MPGVGMASEGRAFAVGVGEAFRHSACCGFPRVRVGRFAAEGIMCYGVGMKIYLVRHGECRSDVFTERGPGLTPRGMAQARAAGAFLRAQGACPKVTLTSGYLRADETAQAVLEALGGGPEPVASPDFTPSGEPEAMRAVLEGIAADEALVVGHMCSIGELAHALCLHAPTVFGHCTVVALEGAGRDWRLLWFKDCGTEGLR